MAGIPMLRLLPFLALSLAIPLSAANPDVYDDLALEIYRQLVEIRSSENFPENTHRLLDGVAERLRSEGFPEESMTFVPSGKVKNLVVRYKGTGAKKALITMAHVDVVDADPDAWQADPFTLAKIDGYYYGRGTSDNKAGAATLITNFIRLKREGFHPARDLIMVLTGDEESTMGGITAIAQEHPELINDAELGFNTDAGGGELGADGRPQVLSIQMSEKMYQSFVLTVTNRGGHSSRPVPNNAIYRLAHALTRLESYRFPIQMNEVVRESLRVRAEVTPGETGELMAAAAVENPDPEILRKLAAADAGLNASIRTTCVATMLKAGVAENALPRLAQATVNCRLLPGVTPEEVQSTLRELVADPEVSVERIGVSKPSDPSPLREDVMTKLRVLSKEFFGDAPIAPSQGTVS
jgi:carboxypeptidase PM20D1